MVSSFGETATGQKEQPEEKKKRGPKKGSKYRKKIKENGDEPNAMNGNKTRPERSDSAAIETEALPERVNAGGESGFDGGKNREGPKGKI